MINWIKNLFKSKPSEADLRPPAIGDAYIAQQKKRAEVFKNGGPKAVKKWESREARREVLSPSYPPRRPTDGYQPSLKARTAPPTRSSEPVTQRAADTTDAVADALLMQSVLSTHSVPKMPIMSAPAPHVEVKTVDRTIDPPAYSPPPAPSYEPTYTSSPSFSSSDSYSSSDSDFSSSSFD